MRVKFTVDGEPQGKGRPRFNRRTGITYTPSDTKAYEALVITAYKQKNGTYKFPDNTALDLRIRAYFSIPESDSKKKQKQKQEHEIRPTKKPDWDNIGKIIADSLNGVAYNDDTQIVDAQVRKFYSHAPRVDVTIEEAKI